MLRATWYEGTAQLLILTELKSHLFELYFIGWTTKPMEEGRKPEYPEKTPGDELQKMPYMQPKDSSPKRDSNPHSSIGGRPVKADMLTVTPRVASYIGKHDWGGRNSTADCALGQSSRVMQHRLWSPSDPSDVRNVFLIVNTRCDSAPYNSFGWEYSARSSLVTRVVPSTDLWH